MTGPARSVAAVRAAVRRDLADLPAGTLVLVGCSGGADSLALAAATAFVAPRAGLRAGAVVVDHGLQAGSADVARDAALACRDLGLDPVDVVRVDVAGGAGRTPRRPAGGPEAAARTARYAALEEAAQRHGAGAVLLGHTLDDQAETVLLGLARGSGGRSLAGMAAHRGVLRRPLLGLRRAQTEDVCEVLGLQPWRDPTNGGPTLGDVPPVVGPPGELSPGTAPATGLPLRSRVRHEVLPVLERVLGPGVAEALARTADQLRQDADLLDGLGTDVLAAARSRAVLPPGTGDVQEALDVEVLLEAPAALRTRALRAALLAAGCPAGALRQGHVRSVEDLVVAWSGQGPVSLPEGRSVLRRCGTLVVLSQATQGAARGGCLGHG